jgi:hypothetical protein
MHLVKVAVRVDLTGLAEDHSKHLSASMTTSRGCIPVTLKD